MGNIDVALFTKNATKISHIKTGIYMFTISSPKTTIFTTDNENTDFIFYFTLCIKTYNRLFITKN